MLVDNGHAFKEKKRPAKEGKKMGHKFERVDQKKKKKDKAEEVKEVAKRPEPNDLQEKAIFFLKDLYQFGAKMAQENPQQFMVGCILLMALVINWRIGSMQSQLYYQNLKIENLAHQIAELTAFEQNNPS
jgi:hypothetical protein